MGALVSYQLAEAGDPVATVTMDDGKVNALSPALQAELHAALDQAQADGAVVVVAGRDGVFSAGFDLDTLNAGGPRRSPWSRAASSWRPGCWRSRRPW